MKNLSTTLRLSALACACLSCVSGYAQTTPQLKEVVITANRLEQALQTAPIGASVILGDDIRASGVLDANEAVRKLGGVSARSDLNGGREYSIDLRGYGDASAQNLVVVIDGVRISENELASARLSAILPDQIERIEIVRGGSSVMWGEGASGGVIAVTTKQGATKPGFAGSVQQGFESYGGRDTRVGVQVATSSNVVFTAGLRQYSNDGYRQNSAQKQDVANFGLQVGENGFKARVGYHNERQNARLPGALTLAETQADPRKSNELLNYGGLAEDRFTAGLEYATKNGWLFALDMASRERQSDGHFDFGGDYDRRSTSDSTQVSPRLGYSTSFDGIAFSGVVGLDSLRWKFASQSVFDGFPAGDETAAQYSKATYARVDFLFPAQTRLVLGARRESFSKSSVDALNAVSYEYNNNLSAWELGINQTFAAHWDAYARAAKSYRLPNVDENRGSPVNLRAPIAKDREFGLKYARQGTRAALRFFTQRSVDELAYNPAAPSLTPLFGVNINQDAITRKGFEMEVSTPIAPAWDVTANLQSIKASYSDGPNQGKLVPLVDKLTVAARVAYRMTAQHRFELAAKHHSSSVLGTDYSNTCSERIPASTTFDFGYRYNQAGDKQAAGGWTLSAGVDNLTNKRSYSFAYATTPCADSTAYPEPGRTLKINARYAF